jgi:fatty-acyl-CoA synthase
MALLERVHGSTIASILAHRATTEPERPFLLHGNGVLTYGQVESRAEALAAGLHSLGIGAGDRVALILPCRPEFVIAFFAAAKLGAQVVPLNPRLTGPELQYMLRHSEAAVAVTIETWHGVDYLQLFEDFLVQLPALEYAVTVGEEDLWYDDRIFQFEDLVSKGEGRDYVAGNPDPAGDMFALLYTSGTTGKPKGVELTQANLLHAAAATVEMLGLHEEDRIIGVTAFFHVFGIAPGLLGALLSGAALVLQEDFDGPATLDLVEKHGVTVHYGIPTFFVTELQEQRRRPRDLSSLRLGLVAGSPASAGMIREVSEELCPGLLVAYSLTETASTICMTSPEDPGEKRHFTVGRPVAGAEVKVLDPAGAILPVESVGEIVLRGPGIMRGYYRQPRETAASFVHDGFLRTGDLGMVDEDGYVHLVGRGKDVIIRGGSTVHPREVEDRILAHPAVRAVVAVGVPDEVLGEAIFACVALLEGAMVSGDELKDWCRKTLAGYKIPDTVRFMEEFPQTATGKVRRSELARLLRDEMLNRSQ